MTQTATKPAEITPDETSEAPPTPGRYDTTIRRMEEVLGRKRTERSQTSEQYLIDSLDPEIANLEEAIALFREANDVEPKLTQFGGEKMRTMVVAIPPASKEFRFRPIRFQRYIYATREPVEIVLLRRMVGDPDRYGDLREMKVGLQAAVARDTGKVIGFYPEDHVRDLFNAGVLQSQIG